MQTKKKIAETDAIFENIKKLDESNASNAGAEGQGVDGAPRAVISISVDCKATVKTGELSRGGMSRSLTKAQDHDMEYTGKYTPFGLLDQGSGQLSILFGESFKTSDFIADGLSQWWADLDPKRKAEAQTIQIKMDNGPESSGSRTQFLKRMVEWSDEIGKTLHLVYYPPYHSKYNPIERCWGVLELHWNGALLTCKDTMLAWARSMTWSGLTPVVGFLGKVYEKGVALTKTEMKPIEDRLERSSTLPKWDIFIHPLAA